MLLAHGTRPPALLAPGLSARGPQDSQQQATPQTPSGDVCASLASAVGALRLGWEQGWGCGVVRFTSGVPPTCAPLRGQQAQKSVAGPDSTRGSGSPEGTDGQH